MWLRKPQRPRTALMPCQVPLRWATADTQCCTPVVPRGPSWLRVWLGGGGGRGKKEEVGDGAISRWQEKRPSLCKSVSEWRAPPGGGGAFFSPPPSQPRPSLVRRGLCPAHPARPPRRLRPWRRPPPAPPRRWRRHGGLRRRGGGLWRTRRGTVGTRLLRQVHPVRAVAAVEPVADGAEARAGGRGHGGRLPVAICARGDLRRRQAGAAALRDPFIDARDGAALDLDLAHGVERPANEGAVPLGVLACLAVLLLEGWGRVSSASSTRGGSGQGAKRGQKGSRGKEGRGRQGKRGARARGPYRSGSRSRRTRHLRCPSRAGPS